MINNKVRTCQNPMQTNLGQSRVSHDVEDSDRHSAVFSSFFGWFLAGDFGWFPPVAAANETNVARERASGLLTQVRDLFQTMWLNANAYVLRLWHGICKKHQRESNQGVSMIATTVRDLSISVRSKDTYEITLLTLREALKRSGFEVLCEFPVARELERKVGLQWRQLGLHWQQRYTVFVVWSPSDAYQALLSDRDGGLLIPFNVCVAEDGASTAVAFTNHYGPLAAKSSSIGVQLLIRNLTRKFRQVLIEVASDGDTLDNGNLQPTEVRGF
jgi:uncharacterized protein (DUF302 family)